MPLFQASTLSVNRDADGSLGLVLDVPGRSVNVITREVLTDLDAALDAIARETRPPVLLVTSGKKTGFLAGADLAGFLAIRDAAGAQALSAAGQKVFDKLANLQVPTIAAVHGPCLGGGLELALACDYRLVVDRPNTLLGLPEIELGLLPAWGGTQRLPRTIGLERAMQVILAGKRLNARDALAWGLADALARDEADLRQQTVHLIGQALSRGKRPRKGLPLLTWRQRFLESNPIGRRILFRTAERTLRRRVPDDMPGPAEALEAMRVGIQKGLPAGLTQEREAAGRLALTPACRNLVGLFFQRENTRKLPPDTPEKEIQRVGVIGAGVMGAGIAQLAAVKGLEVVVQEVNDEASKAGQVRIADLFTKATERGVLSPDEAARRQAAIRPTTTWEGFDQVELVVEAAVEDLDLKRKLFRDLEGRVRPETVLATNTSSLTVGSLTEGLSHPERVAGLHFFNPVHKMPLVEVVRTSHVPSAVVGSLLRLTLRLGKTPVVVGDGPGFVVNRILMPYLNEAVLLLGEGLSIADIDGVMKRFGMPMGPLELLDQIGLDVAAHVARSIGPAMGERFTRGDAFEKMTSQGWLGQKKGVGFYLHKGRKATVNPDAQALLQGKSATDLPRAAWLAQARDRMVLLMVNEAARVLEEGLAPNGETVDLAMVMGTGWAPHRGGPLQYADDRGLRDIVQALNTLAGRFGKRFEPAAGLQKRADSGEPFRRPPTEVTG
jgi:3-hydroxyacyl-CoA dehydrogenase/enoyl-CoA hydratase/3-hydroxybutyryl-CoA epimerase